MDRSETEKKYEDLSPFELKNKLISMSGDHGVRMIPAPSGNVLLTIWGSLIVNLV
jgi:hypothetical protein